MKYTYSFVLWSRKCAETQEPAISAATRKCLEMTKSRIDPSPMTEREFDALREELFHLGFECMEIERIPYHEPEGIL